MARRSKKRGGEPEHENHERWLLTYADMITLLTAFFIMLYAMSVMNVTKFQQLAISVRSGFGGSMTNGAPTIINAGGGISGIPAIVSNSKQKKDGTDDFPPQVPTKSTKTRRDEAHLDKAYGVIKSYIKKHKLERMMRVVHNERGVVISIMTDKMLFARGDSDLRPEEMPMLDTVIGAANQLPNSIRVEGHTDDLPIHTARFPSNWELSTTRATTVLRYFETRHIDPKRLEAAGYADQRPIVSNDSEDDRARNRRVEIVLLKLT